MQIHLKITGVLLVAIALLHFSFPKYFKWKEELVPLSIINRQLMYVHSFFIALVVFLIGLLCLTSSYELISTTLGRRICLGIGIFWLIRLCTQFFGYTSETWKGKRFETTVHVVFSVFWIYFTWVFMVVYLR
jgi:hypothetical protein